MTEFTKGEIAGGWVYILKDKMPVGLVHPKYVDKFIASDDMHKVLKRAVREMMSKDIIPPNYFYEVLAKAE